MFIYLSIGNGLTSISWSPIISSINSAKGFSALFVTRAAKTGDSKPAEKNRKSKARNVVVNLEMCRVQLCGKFQVLGDGMFAVIDGTS